MSGETSVYSLNTRFPLNKGSRSRQAFEWALLLVDYSTLALILYGFWFPVPARIHALLLFIPLYAIRLIIDRRLWHRSPLDRLLAGFLLLGVLNVIAAPHTGGLFMLGRPVMGLLLAGVLADRLARAETPRDPLLATSILSLLIGLAALLASQWTIKSSLFSFIIEQLPTARALFDNSGLIGTFIGGGFNVNEIAGAMVWLAPLMAALALTAWGLSNPTPFDRALRFLASAAFCLLWLALFLGQSRFAIFGALPVLAIIVALLAPSPRWRWLGLLTTAAFALLQLMLLANLFGPERERLQQRDEDSISARLLIWDSAVQIIRDHPLTGAGMNMYRSAPVRARYPVPGYEIRVLPHAHNELLQIGADLGVPGLLIFIGWHGALALMLWSSWQRSNAQTAPHKRSLALGIGGGLLAHAIFGLGDAIPLWDRFAFIYWWLVGLIIGLYVRTRKN
ncbi:MAG: O-antigen ligase family protein [Aggregatilineales bacterium]